MQSCELFTVNVDRAISFQGCKKWRVLERCCEFQCLDEPSPTGDDLFELTQDPVSTSWAPRIEPTAPAFLLSLSMLLWLRWTHWWHPHAQVKPHAVRVIFTFRLSFSRAFAASALVVFLDGWKVNAPQGFSISACAISCRLVQRLNKHFFAATVHLGMKLAAKAILRDTWIMFFSQELHGFHSFLPQISQWWALFSYQRREQYSFSD